jgi:hypothetical protein
MHHWQDALLSSYSIPSKDGGIRAFYERVLGYWGLILTVSGLYAGFIFTATLDVPRFEERQEFYNRTAPEDYNTVISAAVRDRYYGASVYLSFTMALCSCFLALCLSAVFAILGPERARSLAEKMVLMKTDEFFLVEWTEDAGPFTTNTSTAQSARSVDTYMTDVPISPTAGSEFRRRSSMASSIFSNDATAVEPPPVQEVHGSRPPLPVFPSEWQHWSQVEAKKSTKVEKILTSIKEQIVFVSLPASPWHWKSITLFVFDIPVVMLGFSLISLGFVASVTVGGLYEDLVAWIFWAGGAFSLLLFFGVVIQVGSGIYLVFGHASETKNEKVMRGSNH